MKKITVLAPAKLNLTLDVVGLVPGGYHAMDMIMQAIDLFERVTVETAPPERLEITCSNRLLPTGGGNTAYKAACAFFKEVGLAAGAKISIEKTVPVKAGMAGGSADAAAVLVALNALYGAGLSPRQLADIGFSVGADVPFAVLGGTAHATGVGEVLAPLRPLPPCWFVVCMPEYGIRTPEAFARYDRVGADCRPCTTAALAAVETGNLTALSSAMGNALEKAAAGRHTREITAQLKSAGALAAQMTGSGAAVFGLFCEESAARRALAALQKSFPQCFLARPFKEGAFLEEKKKTL